MAKLDRFIEAQRRDYDDAYAEIKNGFKSGHWMWYIFPQLKGLGNSPIAEYYGIESLEEAIDYLANDYLRNNLVNISKAILEVNDKDIMVILGFPDYLKLQSSMTLFEIADPSIDVFRKVIDKYYKGSEDSKTYELLGIVKDKTRGLK